MIEGCVFVKEKFDLAENATFVEDIFIYDRPKIRKVQIVDSIGL